MPAGMLGALPPHPESTHPRVKLSDHLSVAALPPTPAVVDYASKVRMWPMYLNDQLGDCTCAGIAHAVQAWTAYAKGLVTLPNSAVLNLYERMGYVPGNPATDQGAVEQDVLAEVHRNGIGGHKILAYAQVDHEDPYEMKAALNLFGSLYLGAQMPQSAMDQTNAGQPWSLVPGSPDRGRPLLRRPAVGRQRGPDAGGHLGPAPAGHRPVVAGERRRGVGGHHAGLVQRQRQDRDGRRPGAARRRVRRRIRAS